MPTGKSDEIGGRKQPKERRVSLTFRNALLDGNA